ncbi:MAG: metallophosphoesterase [Betaproteobacteria bacterium]|nr:MAG: metallophosphoesterase [Betaproteobacteria bacterium]
MASASRELSLGLISDTHGLMRPEALAALAGSRHIVHAGDIGHPGVLERLARIAPVTAVRGNNDTGRWASGLRETEILEIRKTRILVIHDLSELEPDPAGIDVVVAGHSHRPHEERRGGVLYVNPGSAGPRRFTLPVAVGRLQISGKDVRFELVPL